MSVFSARALASLLYQQCRSVSTVAGGYNEVSSAVVAQLEEVVGRENCATSESVRQHHARDESYHKGVTPGAVIFPRCTTEVSVCARICNQHGVPIIPYGTGTGMEGGVVPLHAGVTFNMMKMDKILSASSEDFTATVESGVTRKTLNNYLKDQGVWFPIDPGADASICGMAATSASGTNAVRYGTMRENVLNLEVVLADGSIFETGGQDLRCRKTAAGYNLTNLFVGSEGTLGLITRATVRLYGVPESIISAVVHFPDVKSAVEATVLVLQAGIPVARIELLDEVMMRGCINYSNLTNMEEVPTLFLEFHGSQTKVEEESNVVAGITSSCGGSKFLWASDLAERNKLWTARHNAFYAGLSLRPGCRAVVTDVAVPISQLTEIIMSTKEDVMTSKLIGPIVGHVGDGNFHVQLNIDPDSEEELAKASEIAKKAALKAISVGGTCTGEHGVGLGKKELVAVQRGVVGIGVMRAIKEALDPRGVMNPKKIFE